MLQDLLLTATTALITQYCKYLFSVSFKQLDHTFPEVWTMSWSPLYFQCPRMGLKEEILYSLYFPWHFCSRYTGWIPCFEHTKLDFSHDSLFVLDASVARNVFPPLLLSPCEFIQGQSHNFLMFYFILCIITRPAKLTLSIRYRMEIALFIQKYLRKSSGTWVRSQTLLTAVLMTCYVTLSKSLLLSGPHFP